jgi:hypothetical protein
VPTDPGIGILLEAFSRLLDHAARLSSGVWRLILVLRQAKELQPAVGMGKGFYSPTELPLPSA